MPAVLYTGGAGRIGRVIREGLAGRYETVRLLSPKPVEPLYENETVVRGDLGDLEVVEEAVEGVDVIVHLGAVADEAPFDAILRSNVVGTYHVFEAARRQGVRRVVFASSNHVIGFYPMDTPVTSDMPVRPDTLYGVSKVFGEALASLYHDKWQVEAVCLRIGSFRAKPEDERQLSTWLSHWDGIELVRCSIEAPQVGWVVIFGVSANQRSWWKDDFGAATIGFRAVDDSEIYAEGLLGVGRPGARSAEALGRQGGVFTDPDYVGGTW